MDESQVPLTPHADRARVPAMPGTDRSIGDLFKQLTSDMDALLRQEMSLAKAEMREVGNTLARDGAKVGVAAALALAGFLALVAFLIAGLGSLLDGRYWLSALIVGAVFLAVGGLLVRNAIADVKRRGLTPAATIASARDDAQWVTREAKEFKREVTKP